jgi:hypothetical protein
MKRILGILLFILVANVAAFAQVDLLGTACEPYGSISIHGEPAADNLPVVAYINGVEFGRCLTLGGQYQLYIAKDNLETPEKDGWDTGDIIMIKISGNLANPSLTAIPGRSRVDLSVNTLSVRLDTWGKIKALFK